MKSGILQALGRRSGVTGSGMRDNKNNHAWLVWAVTANSDTDVMHGVWQLRRGRVIGRWTSVRVIVPQGCMKNGVSLARDSPHGYGGQGRQARGEGYLFHRPWAHPSVHLYLRQCVLQVNLVAE
jgi:hypothetical protein